MIRLLLTIQILNYTIFQIFEVLEKSVYNPNPFLTSRFISDPDPTLTTTGARIATETEVELETTTRPAIEIERKPKRSEDLPLVLSLRQRRSTNEEDVKGNLR